MRPIPKPRRLPLTFWAAVALLLAAAGLGVLWAVSDALDDLAANLVTELVGIAITITAVEWVLRRQAQERLKPRTDDVLYWMGLSFRMYTGSVISDYATTHMDTFKPLPRDATELIDQWRAGQDTEDEPRHLLEGEWLPTIVLSAVEFDQDLRRARERDIDVLEPDLVRAIDSFGWHVAQCVQGLGFVREGLLEDKSDRVPISTLMRGTQEFAGIFRRYGKTWFEILDLQVNGTLASREHIIRSRREHRDPDERLEPPPPST